MKTLALVPPKPVLNLPRRKSTVVTCSSCDGPLNGTGECRGCSE